MTVLVIIKGQLRTWDLNYKYIAQFIDVAMNKLNLSTYPAEGSLPPVRADILLSCWDLSYQVYPDCYSANFLTKEKEIFTDEINEFKKSPLINEFYVHQENYLEASELFSNLKFELPEDYHFSCYLTYKTGLEKRRLEALNNKPYDLILEIRPDVYYSPTYSNVLLPKIPLFGEILSFDGAVLHTISGLLSTSINDLIFLMTGKTYDIFSKEIIFHYDHFIKKFGFTTVHFEKNLFLNKKNLIVQNLRHSLCHNPIIVRPTDSPSVITDEPNNEIQRSLRLKIRDEEWMQEKEKNLQIILSEQQNTFGAFLNYKKNQNRNKINEVLNQPRPSI